MRTIQIYDGENWNDEEWSAVVSGSLIRIFEENGDPVKDGTGIMEWTTVSDSYIQTIDGVGDVWTVKVLDPSERPITE